MASRIKKIPLTELSFHSEIQRTNIEWARVRRMAKAFNPDALGVITVSARPDGSNLVLDGMHRCSASEMAGHTAALDCKVLTGLTIQQEAELFRLLNATKVPSLYDRLRIRHIEGEPLAVHIYEVCRKFGWEPSSSTTDGRIGALGALESVAKMDEAEGDGKILEGTIGILTQAWGHAGEGVNNAFVLGVGKILDRYRDQIDAAKIVAILSKRTPDYVLAQVNTWKGMTPTKSDALAHWVMMEYNKRKSANALEPWM